MKGQIRNKRRHRVRSTQRAGKLETHQETLVRIVRVFIYRRLLERHDKPGQSNRPVDAERRQRETQSQGVQRKRPDQNKSDPIRRN